MDVVVQFMQLHRKQGIKVDRLRKVNKLAFPPMKVGGTFHLFFDVIDFQISQLRL